MVRNPSLSSLGKAARTYRFQTHGRDGAHELELWRVPGPVTSHLAGLFFLRRFSRRRAARCSRALFLSCLRFKSASIKSRCALLSFMSPLSATHFGSFLRGGLRS